MSYCVAFDDPAVWAILDEYITFHARGLPAPMAADKKRLKPTKVICNNPATVVFFNDGTKAVTKAHDGDGYSWVTGIAFCCLRKSLHNRNYDRYEKPISKLVEKVYRRNPNDMGGELRAIADGLMLMADALEVNDEA